MKRFIRLTLEIIVDVLYAVGYFVKNNLTNFASILSLALPFVMYFVGQSVATSRNEIAVGSEIFIPILVCIVVYYLRSMANKLGKGYNIPTPDKRFTEVDEDGEVSVRNDRVQELILYLADLEDWLERKGLL